MRPTVLGTAQTLSKSVTQRGSCHPLTESSLLSLVSDGGSSSSFPHGDGNLETGRRAQRSAPAESGPQGRQKQLCNDDKPNASEFNCLEQQFLKYDIVVKYDSLMKNL